MLLVFYRTLKMKEVVFILSKDFRVWSLGKEQIFNRSAWPIIYSQRWNKTKLWGVLFSETVLWNSVAPSGWEQLVCKKQVVI